MRSAALPFLAILLAAGAAQAAEPDICSMTSAMRMTTFKEAKTNSDCEKKADGQDQINDCELYRFVLSQAALTETYNRALTVVAKFERPAQDDAKIDLKAAFVNAQTAWCASREASCDFDADSLEGGSMSPMIAFACRRAKNEARIKALETLVTCYRGDCQWPPLLYMYEMFPNNDP